MSGELGAVDNIDMDEPEIGAPVSDVVGAKAEIRSTEPMRAQQIGAALENQGVAVTMPAARSELSSSFHRSGVPEQPQQRTAALGVQPQLAVGMSRKA